MPAADEPVMILGDYVTQREPFPEGQHVATCYGVVNIGTHSSEFQGQTRIANRLVVLFEVPALRYLDKGPDGKDRDRPKAYSVRYALSLSDKSSYRNDLEAWRGRKFGVDDLKKFNVFSVVGAPALLQIVHEPRDDGSISDRLNSIMALPKQMPRPAMENPPLKYAYDKAAKRWPAFPDHLPDWLRNLVMASKEWEEWEERNAAKTTPGAPAVESAKTSAPPPSATAPDAADDQPYF